MSPKDEGEGEVKEICLDCKVPKGEGDCDSCKLRGSVKKAYGGTGRESGYGSFIITF